MHSSAVASFLLAGSALATTTLQTGASIASAKSSAAIDTTSAPSGSTISTGPCSGITTSTQTQQNGYYVVVTSGTSFITVSSAPTTVKTVRTLSPTTVYAYTSTTTVTSTTTSTVLTIKPAETTVSALTSPGFTPILCEPSYVNPTTFLPDRNTTGTVPTYIYKTVTTGSSTYTQTTFVYTSIKTTTSTLQNVRTVPMTRTVTTTLTRADKTSTVYAACSSINITPYNPGNQYLGNVNPRGPYGYQYARVPALDPVDCCSLCQGNSSCSGSAYGPNYNPPCILFIQDYPANVTCDPRLVGESTVYGSSLTFYISNSACGQYIINP